MKYIITILFLFLFSSSNAQEYRIYKDKNGECWDSIVVIICTNPESFEWMLIECECPDFSDITWDNGQIAPIIVYPRKDTIKWKPYYYKHKKKLKH